MRRLFKLSAFCIVAAVASACSTPDVVIPTEDIPTGGVRFINAVPDAPWGTGLDFRFIDNVENNAQWQMTFRNGPQRSAAGPSGITSATLTEYKPARAGVRKFRIFPNDTVQAVASLVLVDGTMTIEKDHNYSVIMMGNAAQATTLPVTSTPQTATAMRIVIIDETVPEPAGGKIAMRVLNTTASPIDGRTWLVGTAAPATPTWANIPAFSASTYATLDTGAYAFRVSAAGGSPFTCDGRSILGQNAITGAPGPFDAIPGTRASGSAMSAIAFSGSVSGTQSAQFATTTGLTSIAATTTGFAAARSFLTDCFVVGQTIDVTGFATAGNNGTATVTAITDGRTTGSTSLSATATGYARAAGSFITDGFAANDWITASGFTNAANNGVSQIVAVTATTLTVTKATGPVVEAAATGRTITSFGKIDVSKAVAAEAPAAGRAVAVSPNPVGHAFVWDRRPPRPPGV